MWEEVVNSNAPNPAHGSWQSGSVYDHLRRLTHEIAAEGAKFGNHWPSPNSLMPQRHRRLINGFSCAAQSGGEEIVTMIQCSVTFYTNTI